MFLLVPTIRYNLFSFSIRHKYTKKNAKMNVINVIFSLFFDIFFLFSFIYGILLLKLLGFSLFYSRVEV